MPKRLLLLLLLAPALLGCRKDVDAFFNKLVPPPPPITLPAETQSGANTFGCLVNGQVWEAKNGPTSFIGNAYSPNARYSRREISISAFWRPESRGPVTAFSLTAPRVVGRTAIGRTTAWLLRMNSEERIELRTVLMELGELD